MKKNAVSILCGVLALILLTACCFLLTSGKITAVAQEACSDKDPALLPAAGTALKPYGVIIAVSAAAALAAGYFLACRKQTRSWRDMSLFSLISIGGGLVLSRLMYVACSFTQNWCNELFWQSAGPLRLWDGGLSMTGVLLAMLLAGLLVPSCRQATGLAAPLFIAGARYAETFTGLDDIYSAMGFGGFSVGDEDLEICPWYAIETDYDFRLNVRFFEILIALLIFIAVLVVPYLLKKRKTGRRSEY
ncbi:MAG: hypothetical protein CW338_05140, partial [Clostridiales bacterium]|nr:hypothetical protein [Clostridiales bacterium]